MTYSWPVYIVLAIVAAVSFGTALFLPTADILRWVSGVPALVALIGVVLQIFEIMPNTKNLWLSSEISSISSLA